MRAILISVAILFTSGPMLAQQRKQPPPVPRTFVPYEPQPCIEFDRMAARLDAVSKTEALYKPEYDEGVKTYRVGTQEVGVDYFIAGVSQLTQRSPMQANVIDLITNTSADHD